MIYTMLNPRLPTVFSFGGIYIKSQVATVRILEQKPKLLNPGVWLLLFSKDCKSIWAAMIITHISGFIPKSSFVFAGQFIPKSHTVFTLGCSHFCQSPSSLMDELMALVVYCLGVD